MSIIHDALKKVQESFSPKAEPAPVTPSATTPASGYLYETPPAVETLPPVEQLGPDQKTPIKTKIKSTIAATCALAITVAITIASIEYIYQQLQSIIPTVQRLAKKSFMTLIHKKQLTKSVEIKPLAQFTIPNKTKPTAPITLDIHGIMSNGSGNLVLINDQVYQEGDEVDGAKITKIDLDSITVVNNGVEQTIPVKN
jgi:hypothetical protein